MVGISTRLVFPGVANDDRDDLDLTLYTKLHTSNSFIVCIFLLIYSIVFLD